MSDQTPMMRQYWAVKEKHRDAILFFRLGDFYEMFFEDAKVASRLLDLTLTSRNKAQEDSVPLCGFPIHSAQGYINKLLSCGHKVAICEQTEDPKNAKGIVKREVVEVLSPGIVLDAECLDGKSQNFVLALDYAGDRWGLAIADISTGAFKLTELFDERKLFDEISRLEPRELLISDLHQNKPWFEKLKSNSGQVRINILAGWNFDPDFGSDLYRRVYQVNPEGLGLSGHPVAARAGGALLSYLSESKALSEGILSRPQVYFFYVSMVCDESVKKNLELLRTIQDQSSQGSLFSHLDRALTPMGSRCLKNWLLYPLLNLGEIKGRHDAIDGFLSNSERLRQVRKALESVSDIERIQNRVLVQKANARDLAALKESFKIIPALKDVLFLASDPLTIACRDDLDPLTDVCSDIEKVLVDDPPFVLKEGGLIREGFNARLDELRDIEKNGKGYISRLEVQERERTGISSLKIRYNRVFGYYIEITHTHKDKIPSDYIRKQTLTSAERYITPELKEYEEKVLSAKSGYRDLEYELFLELRQRVCLQSERVKKTAQSLANLDALSSLALVALEHHYVRPEMTEETILIIKKGRHPLVETLHPEEPFVPNDVSLNAGDCRLMLITGPNMAGKSTVMRQVALICLLAQMGSFVPAEEARLGIIDRIFTRIGASDHLQKGQSTFMVEMLETAHILAHATDKSLILLDEIGRGTSTFDGLSIAWAVAETIHDQVRARTMFATHYHELTDLAGEKEGIKNFHMAIREWKGEIRFLRELKEGGTNRSYGVQVAAMAGLPSRTVARAKEILKLLEEKDLAFQAQAASRAVQPSLFDEPHRWLADEVKNLDLNQMTPLQAMNALAGLKGKLEG